MNPAPDLLDPSIETLMAATVGEALRSETEGGQPVGSLVIDTAGRVVGRGHNRIVQDRDILAHAEIVAVRSIADPVDLRCTTLTTTAEPCWLCAGMIVQVGIPRVVVGRTVDGGRIDWLRLRGVEVVEAADQASADITDRYFRPRSRTLIPGKELGAFPAEELGGNLPDGAMTLAGWASVYRFRRVPVPRTRVAVLVAEPDEMDLPAVRGGGGVVTADGSAVGASPAPGAARQAALRGTHEVVTIARRHDIPVVHGAHTPPDWPGGTGARSVVLCGARTSAAVLASAVEARTRGLGVYVVADATADDEEAVHVSALYAIDRSFGIVCHVDDLTRSWSGGGS